MLYDILKKMILAILKNIEHGPHETKTKKKKKR